MWMKLKCSLSSGYRRQGPEAITYGVRLIARGCRSNEACSTSRRWYMITLRFVCMHGLSYTTAHVLSSRKHKQTGWAVTR